MNLSKEQRIKGIDQTRAVNHVSGIRLMLCDLLGTPLSEEQLQKSYQLLTAEYAYEEELNNEKQDDSGERGFNDYDFRFDY